MNQITVRGFDDELSASLAEGSGRADTVGAAFDHLIGSWTPRSRRSKRLTKLYTFAHIRICIYTHMHI